MANEINALNTRGQVATAVASFIQDSSTARRTMILLDLDRAYRDVLRRHEWPQLVRWVDAAVSVVANQAFFFLPKDLRQILRIQDATTPMSLAELGLPTQVDATSGFPGLSGLPLGVSFTGEFGVNATLTAATALEVLSSAADTRVLWISGVLSGEAKTTSVTLNGTTPVALGTWDEVFAITLTTTSTTLTATVRIVTANTQVAKIAPNETKATYRRYRLFPVPGGAHTLRVIYKFTPPQVFDEGHEYLIPGIQDYLMEWAIAASYESRREHVKAQPHFQQAEVMLANIVNEVCGRKIDVWIPASPYGVYDRQGGGRVYNRHGG